MTESIQVLLIVVITVLATLLVVIGFQLLSILKEVKKSLGKINQILDDSSVVSSTFAKSVSGASAILAGVKSGLTFLDFFRKKRKEENGEKE